MNDHRARLAEALDALWINNTSYTWFGRRHAVLPARAAAMDRATVLRYLTDALRQRLYVDFYCTGMAVPDPPARPADTELRDTPSYRDSLSAANLGTGSAEGQWRVVGVDGQHTVVDRHGLQLWVTADELVAGHGAGPGDEVSIRLPNALPHRSPGFYLALGDAAFPEMGAGNPLIRIYWNLTPEGAPVALRVVTSTLNEALIPFQFKVVNDPARFGRRDSGVLYLLGRHYRQAGALLSARFELLRETLVPGGPAFTKELAPGLALAEDPGEGGSFGLHRCGLVARALVQAHHDQTHDEQGHHRRLGRHWRGFAESRMAAVAERLHAHGIDLDRAHLNPGSSDVYPVLAAL
ncbi:T3SS effector HopA1 family protein [Phytohabitans sp. LJ34]|uniref:T3SS effector HopA1 family protein n=1 Tax=Phytohabitans sp. LJ34 TaxID=3452217 RepID=UPI003F89D0DF